MSREAHARFYESPGVRFLGATHLVLLARTESEARQAWERLQGQFAALRLVVNQEKSRLTTVEKGFAFLGFEFRKPRCGCCTCGHARKRANISATGCAKWFGRFPVARRLGR